jgi:transposase
MHKREERPFAAFIGIDWADKKHDVCLCVPGVEQRERLVLEHSPRAIQDWAEKLRERFDGAPVAVAVELTEGPIVSALLEHDFFVLFPVQPAMLARYRLAFTPSRAKDDPTDAELALEVLLRHPDKLKRLEPESPAMRSLRRLVEARRSLVEDRTRLTNRITSALKAYFPQVLGWFRDKEAGVFADFLARWPTLEGAQRARQGTLEDFFRTRNVRYAAAIERRIEAIRTERPLHTDAAMTEPMRLLVEALLPQLRAVSAGIERFDAAIAELAPTLPDYGIFAAPPGAGPALAPRLLVAFGERRERFPNAAIIALTASVFCGPPQGLSWAAALAARPVLRVPLVVSNRYDLSGGMKAKTASAHAAAARLWKGRPPLQSAAPARSRRPQCASGSPLPTRPRDRSRRG